MDKNFKFNFGDTVKDTISGVCGIVDSRSTYLINENKYFIWVNGLIEGFDESQLVLEKSGDYKSPDVLCRFCNGDMVADIFTKTRGTIMGIAEYAAGCFRAGILTTNPRINQHGMQTWVFISDQQLKLIKPARKNKYIKKLSKELKNEKINR